MTTKLTEQERIRSDFLKAIERIVTGFPENERLKKLRDNNKLKLNFTNVALEAGRSRTLIAVDGSKYSDVREKILKGEKINNKIMSSTDLIRRLREEVKSLEEKIVKIREAQARDFYALNDAISEANRWRNAYLRLKENRLQSGKIRVFQKNES